MGDGCWPMSLGGWIGDGCWTMKRTKEEFGECYARMI